MELSLKLWILEFIRLEQERYSLKIFSEWINSFLSVLSIK